MGPFFRSSALVPPGFLVDSAKSDDATVRIAIHAKSPEGCCPGYGRMAVRIHSRYQRRLPDLPLSGRTVQLMMMARRSTATPFSAAAVSLQSASLKTFSRHGHGGQPASIISSIISASR